MQFAFIKVSCVSVCWLKLANKNKHSFVASFLSEINLRQVRTILLNDIELFFRTGTISSESSCWFKFELELYLGEFVDEWEVKFAVARGVSISLASLKDTKEGEDVETEKNEFVSE